ncbi:MAG: undecaprenyldiphospho-muramoylpentapeptide beta-N-acetylglucosaminyltransferase [Cytophagales bacterium]
MTNSISASMPKQLKIIISGGGTGGHIFPAIAIANELKLRNPETEILFVGAEGRMEMEKVPQAGYKIIGLNVAGIQRQLNLKNIIKNLQFPFKLIDSLVQARKIIKEFKPNVVIGVGGYASGPILWAAQGKKIPTLIQEQNSFAGITNKILGKKANKICIAYEDVAQYFPKEKIVLTGNPVRKDILHADLLRLPAMLNFKLSAEKKTILVIGGSLGARTINQAIENDINKLIDSGYQLVWQTGKNFDSTKIKYNGSFFVSPFIKEMHWAYAAADVIISRAGALSVSELCIIGKPVILVPSPNVSEDHQTKNAMALVNKDAAILVKDADAKGTLVDKVLELLKDESQCDKLSANIKMLEKPKATEEIVDEVLKMIV